MIKLLPHQSAALERTRKFNNVAYYHDMGLGKTFVGAEKAVQFGSRQILVVCQKSKINDWIEHFNTHYSLPVFDLSKKKELDVSYIGVGVINYDLLTRRQSLLNMRDFVLMLDESSE